MMAAVQPFLSGAISKTVNLPETATVEDIADVYLQGWKLGLKALAVYRDNCKVGQPLSDGKKKEDKKAEAEPAARGPGRVPAAARAPAQDATLAHHLVQRRWSRGLHDQLQSTKTVASANCSSSSASRARPWPG
jgi:ribonucleotide reductase alpha subunit